MIKGIIFDMDGVISDTQKLHSKAESDLLKEYGVDISPEEITKRYSGVRTKEMFEELLKEKNKNYDINILLSSYWSQMEKSASISVDEVPGSVNLIKYFYNNNLFLALVSYSNKNYVLSVLKKLNVFKYFSIIVVGDMVLKGKPNPEGFLLAASKMKLDPFECVVIEDGVAGMDAARNGNIKSIGLVRDKNGTYPTLNLVTNLSEITLEYLSNLK